MYHHLNYETLVLLQSQSRSYRSTDSDKQKFVKPTTQERFIDTPSNAKDNPGVKREPEWLNLL